MDGNKLNRSYNKNNNTSKKVNIIFEKKLKVVISRTASIIIMKIY